MKARSSSRNASSSAVKLKSMADLLYSRPIYNIQRRRSARHREPTGPDEGSSTWLVSEWFPEAARQNNLIADGVEKAEAVYSMATRVAIASVERLLLCRTLVCCFSNGEHAAASGVIGCRFGARRATITGDVDPFSYGGPEAGNLSRVEAARIACAG